MALFISYSSQDRATVDALTNALRKAQQQVWFDQELGGGDSWWNKILEQIRECEVFVVALSNNWLLSKPSQSELRYARELNRPILPVRIGSVDSMRVNPLATLQIIDYTNPTVDAGIQLVTAVHALRATPVPLPDPLPEEPPVPFGYITRLGNTLSDKELTPQQQIQLLVELRSGFEEDGDDPSARSDIAQLLRMLRLRHDVTYRTRNEIDQVLATIEAKDNPDAAAQSEATTGGTTATQPAGTPSAGAPVTPAVLATGTATAAGGDAGSRNRLLIIGGAAAVVVAIVVAVVFLAMPSGTKKPAAGAGARSTAGATGAPATAGPLESILLSETDIASIMALPSTESLLPTRISEMRLDDKLSDAACLGAFDVIQKTQYADSGFTGVSGLMSHTKDLAYRINEAAVSFPGAGMAQAFVTKSTGAWNDCVNKPVVFTDATGTRHDWTFGDTVKVEGPRLTLLRTRKDGFQCQRVLSAVSAVVLDVTACAGTVTNQGSEITDKMAAKVKR